MSDRKVANKKEIKGILKKPTESEKEREKIKEESLKDTKNHSIVNHAEGVKFNDDELEEYDKQRGQKMKIDEPKTPYHNPADIPSDSDDHSRERSREHSKDSKDPRKNREINPADPRSRFIHQASTSDKSDDRDGDDESTSLERQKKKKDFERKRRMHYMNEFQHAMNDQI